MMDDSVSCRLCKGPIGMNDVLLGLLLEWVTDYGQVNHLDI